MATTIKDINSSIMFGSFTNEELNSIADAVKYARSQLGKTIKRSIATGDKVMFTSTRNGMTYTGTVSKINIKYVIVNTPSGGFRVPANMLEVV